MNKRPVPPDDPELREALRAMAEADANLTTPQRVEDSLMRAWDSRAHTPSSARGRRRIAWTVLALAASLVLAVALRDRWAPVRITPPHAPSARPCRGVRLEPQLTFRTRWRGLTPIRRR